MKILLNQKPVMHWPALAIASPLLSAWQEYFLKLFDAAGQAINAARSKDIELVSRAGDGIVDICEGCHIDFKPELPTMNIYGELSPAAHTLEN